MNDNGMVMSLKQLLLNIYKSRIKFKPQHIHDVVPFQIQSLKCFQGPELPVLKYLNFITGFVSIVTKIKKINQQHFQISRWKINSAMWKCHQRCFIQMVTPQDIIDFKSHSHWGWKGKFHVICLVIRVRNGRVVIGQILRVDSHAVWSLLWIKL